MDQIQNFVHSNAHILLPVLRTTCAVLGLTMLGAGSAALYQPIEFAESFGISLQRHNNSNSSHDAKPPSSNPNPSSVNNSGETQETGAVGLLMVFAGRELALGSAILTLLYLDELRALSVVVFAMWWVVAGDSIASGRYGKRGAYKNHLIPSVLMVWVGPLGLLLHSKA